MGFFGVQTCPICQKEVGAMQKSGITLNDAYVCSECFKKVNKFYGPGVVFSSKPIEDLRKVVLGSNAISKTNIENVKNFTPTNKVSNHFWIDNKNKLIAIPRNMSGNMFSIRYEVDSQCPVFHVNDLVDYELVENNTSITKGGVSIGRALVGGALFGGVGAIVGGVTGKKKQTSNCTSLYIKISTSDINISLVKIDLLAGLSIPKNGLPPNNMLYKNAIKEAESIIAMLDTLSSSVQKEDKSEESSSTEVKETSAADEIRKYKGLLDDGIITQEEFDAKKKQLLGL